MTMAAANPITTGLMQAATQDRYGTSEVITVGAIERPVAGKGQVLIQVHAAAADRGTEHLMHGDPYLIRLAFGLRRPKQPVLGLDVAGTVVAIGEDVTRFTVGDEIFGFAPGSFAEFAVGFEKKLAHKPANVSFEAAAASSVSGLTALQALTDVADVQPGQRVLVIGASGGVGSFAVQVATALGARVDGVASAVNADFVRSLGADTVFDHRTTDLTDIDADYDVVLDIAGRNSIRKLRSVLTDNGTLVIIGGENGGVLAGGMNRQLRAMMLSPFISQRLVMMISKEHHSSIERLGEHLASGAVVPAIERRFPLADAALALRAFETGAARGKSVINVYG